MIHKKQQTNFGCVYATLAMILGGDESFYYQALNRDRNLKKDGTVRKNLIRNGVYDWEVANFLKRYGYEHTVINLNNPVEELFWIPLLSQRFPLYVDGTFKRQGKRGRAALDCHAFAVFEGKIYDPAEDFELDWGCRNYTELEIETVIPIFRENEKFGKGLTD